MYQVLYISSNNDCNLFRILERLGPRAFSSHLRTFADYLVFEFSNTSSGGQHLNRCVESLNDLIWKCNVVTIDRVILALVSFMCFVAILKFAMPVQKRSATNFKRQLYQFQSVVWMLSGTDILSITKSLLERKCYFRNMSTI